ncbi:MmgE/PrpD family protein [Tardiphaga sp. 215_C5_N2_1]|uniref:MmgE/PrpD family protein n=1 Tax=Tardiphaga sp. 215_C5_N2_1 TaxID=3240774 RepID=UPI003F8C8CD1
MDQEVRPADEASHLTGMLSSRINALEYRDLPADVRTVAKQCLLDWIGVSLAARADPLVGIIVDDCVAEQGPGTCTVLGHRVRLPVLQAALVNGAMGHALDYDDVLSDVGHPTAPVAPAAFAVGEQMGASGRDILTAFVAGFETECRVGLFMGRSHYARGWHSTSTYGTFGAMAAAAKLLRLDVGQIGHAFGLAGTQASGLKCVFGTMTKPFHAGRAAHNGILASRLASRGFTSCQNILEAPQGFGSTQSDACDASAAHSHEGRFRILDTLFKYHAACYLTQSSIEAVRLLRQTNGIRPEMVDRIVIGVAPGHLNVCNIQRPRTGLECKFSLRMTAALVLSGENTADERTFSDKNAVRPDLERLCDRIYVEPSSMGTLSTVDVHLRDGRLLSESADVAVVERDLERQQSRIEAKFYRVTRDVLDPRRSKRIVDLISELETIQFRELTRAAAL